MNNGDSGSDSDGDSDEDDGPVPPADSDSDDSDRFPAAGAAAGAARPPQRPKAPVPVVLSAAAAAAAEEARLASVLDNLPLLSVDLHPDMMCCVCLRPSLDNVICCANGHNACRTCADRMTNGRCPQNCGPQLKVDDQFVPNRPLNNLVGENRMLCPYSKDGCCATYKLCEIGAHQSVCDYRTVKCPCARVHAKRLLGCTWKGPECKVEEHLAEVDHGKYAVELGLTHRRQVTRLHLRFDEMNQRCTLMFEKLARSKERDDAHSAVLERLEETLDVVKDHTNKKDGSSARSVQRHKAMSAQIVSLKTERDELAASLENREAVAARAEEHEEHVATLLTQKESITKERDELADLVTLHKNASSAEAAREEAREESIAILENQKEGALKERDECREAHRRLSASHKRGRDANQELQLERGNVHRRLHEMHATLARMCPNATSRSCPCCACGNESPHY